MRNIYVEKMAEEAGREERRHKLWVRIITAIEIAWIVVLIFVAIALYDMITAMAATPYIDGRTGEWVITEVSSQDNAIDINEAPPIQDISNALNALDALEVYVPDSDDDCPVNEAVPLDVEIQEYIWTRCKKATTDYENYYAFILGCIQHESTFRAKATHHNSNGSVDRGIMQINSSNIGKMKRAGLITSAEDLFDPFKCIDCGLWLMNQYIDKFGVSESAYYAYNTGREREGSNKNSRKVMSYMNEWQSILF